MPSITNLSKNDRDFIIRHSLNDELDRSRDLLRKAEQSYDGAGDTPHQERLKAVLRLLNTLQIHDVSFTLRSKIRDENLATELNRLFNRAQNIDFNYQSYRPLSVLVIENASDLDIWNAVFDLIRLVSQTTPPTSIPPSYTCHILFCFDTKRRADEKTLGIPTLWWDQVLYISESGRILRQVFWGKDIVQAKQWDLRSLERSSCWRPMD